MFSFTNRLIKVSSSFYWALWYCGYHYRYMCACVCTLCVYACVCACVNSKLQVIKQKRNSKFWNSSFSNHIWKDPWSSKTRALTLGKRKYKYWGVLALKTEQTDINDCVKSVRIWSFSDPYLVQMLENTDQKNSKCGHFSRSAILFKKN